MTSSHSHFAHAIALFNERQYFECHEVLEDLWRPLPPGAEKIFLQGLIQIAVGLHHLQRHNFTGARNKLQSGLEKLEAVQPETGKPKPHAQNAFHPPIPLPALITATRAALTEVLRLGPDGIANFPEALLPHIGQT